VAEPAPVVSVVIINWNSGEDLVPCLESLAAQTLAPAEVLVADNASADGSLERARARFPHLIYLALGENRGFCGGANAGIARARGEAVLVLNPDTRLDPGFLAHAVDALARERVHFVAPKLLRFDGKTLDSCGQTLSPVLLQVIERGYGEEDRGQFDAEGPIPSACGAAALYGRALLDRLAPGGKLYDEDYFAFREDADVGARARKAGLRGWYEPKAVAYHRRGGTRPREGKFLGRAFQVLGRDEAVQYHILKNRYLFLAKNVSIAGLLLRLPALLAFDGLQLLVLAALRPALLLRLLAIGPLLQRAWAKRSERGERDQG